VRNFLHDHVDPGVFAPDAVRTMIAAFDGAWLPRRGSWTLTFGSQVGWSTIILAASSC
jgi:hypothetical protein